MKEEAKHRYFFSADVNTEKMDLAVTFGENEIPAKLPSFKKTLSTTTSYWENYWTEGGFVDLSESKDLRWKELERRIILSQYVTAVNSIGPLPPQETGLVQNSWYGKFHLEMVRDHVAHFSLWGRTPLMLRSMEYYKKILPVAKDIARRQGYKGARWPKQVGPEGLESPGTISPFLVWQQPHIIYLAELVYRDTPTKETLEEWWEIIRETADFMATFVVKDESTGIYDIGPPLKDIYERCPLYTSKNTPFEAAYWRFGLKLAIEWSKRMGKEPDPLWSEVVGNLAPMQIRDGYKDIPMQVFAYIPLPEGIDQLLLEKTIERIVASHSSTETAMAAARLGRPDLAIKALLNKRRFLYYIG